MPSLYTGKLVDGPRTYTGKLFDSPPPASEVVDFPDKSGIVFRDAAADPGSFSAGSGVVFGKPGEEYVPRSLPPKAQMGKALPGSPAEDPLANRFPHSPGKASTKIRDVEDVRDILTRSALAVRNTLKSTSPSDVAGNIASIADLVVWAGIQMPASALGGALAMATSGENTREGAAKEGRKFGEEVSSLPIFQAFSLLAKKVSSESGPSGVEGLMQHLSEGAEQIAQAVEDKSGGLIIRDEAMILINALLARYAVKGMTAALGKKGGEIPKVEVKVPPAEPTPILDRFGAKEPRLSEAEIADLLGEAPKKALEEKAKLSKKAHPTLKKLGMVDEFGKPLAVGAAVGLGAYEMLREDRPEGAALLASIPFAARIREAEKFIPEDLRPLVERASFGDIEALKSLDQVRMELARRKAPANDLATIDSAVKELEATHFGYSSVAPKWVIPAAAVATLYDRQGNEVKRLKKAVDRLTAPPVEEMPPRFKDRILEAGGFLTLLQLRRLPETTPLRILKERMQNTSHFLEQVEGKMGDSWELSVKDLKAELKGEGISPAERQTFEKILGDKKTITAKELLTGFEEQSWVMPEKTLNYIALASAGAGAIIGTALANDSKVEGALVGGIVGAAASRIRPSHLLNTFEAISRSKEKASIASIVLNREANLTLASADIYGAAREIVKLVPEAERRAAMLHAIEAGDLSSLSPAERQAAKGVRAYYDALGEAAAKSGVLDKWVKDYITHVWKVDSAQASFLEKLFAEQAGKGLSTTSPFAKFRAIKTLAEGMEKGLVPVSEDPAVLMAIYGRSIATAVENKMLLSALRNAKTFDGLPLVAKAKDAPRGWITIDNVHTRGLAFHPDIAGQLRFVFDTSPTRGVQVALSKISDFAKRNAVSASFFHAKALIDAMIGAGKMKASYVKGAAVGAAAGAIVDPDHPFRGAAIGGTAGYVGKRFYQYSKGESPYLKELQKGSAAPLVNDAVRSGLKVSFERGSLALEDTGQSFYSAMEGLQGFADKMFKDTIGLPAGKAVEKYIQVNRAVDVVMWDRLHAGMKLEIWAEKRAQLLENSAREAAKNPKTKILTKEEAGKMAASFTNDMFGGLNWTQIALEAQTRLGREMGEMLLNPSSRRWLQLAIFAPDWTLSTTRAVLGAVDKDLLNPIRTAKGLVSPTSLADLHRQYIVRSALYYLTVADAINYSMSGHHIFDNKDWTFIDWGDGRRMQWSKHIMEPVHWGTKPVQQGLNKLGFLPREALNLTFGTEYLAPRIGRGGDIIAGPPREGSALGHIARGASPISLQQGFGSGEFDGSGALLGFMGTPLYGMTEEKKEKAREKRREKRRKELEAAK